MYLLNGWLQMILIWFLGVQALQAWKQNNVLKRPWAAFGWCHHHEKFMHRSVSNHCQLLWGNNAFTVVSVFILHYLQKCSNSSFQRLNYQTLINKTRKNSLLFRFHITNLEWPLYVYNVLSVVSTKFCIKFLPQFFSEPINDPPFSCRVLYSDGLGGWRS